MYMIIYDTLKKMFRKSLKKKKKKELEYFVLKKIWGVRVCDISEKSEDLWKWRNDDSVRFI